MRVLHVNTADLEGGAARAAHRIHRALRKSGVDSHMLVLRRRDADPHVHQPLSRGDQVAFHRLKLAFSGQLSARQKTPTNSAMHSLAMFPSGLGRWIERSDFDVVHLHWVGEEMLSIGEIARIRQPLCWTMHDMWAFTGSEHYDDLDHPARYERGYTSANRPAGYLGPDLDAWTWRRKLRAWRDKPIELVSPSRWLAGCAQRSQLFSGRPCHVIPNCIDTNVYRPIDARTARQLLGLKADRRYVLFGAMSSTSDPRKGFHLLQPALQRLAQRLGRDSGVELLVFGGHEPAVPPDLGLPAQYLGSFQDDLSLALLYSAADVFVAPSTQDNLPNTLVEALACGTPCVAFEVGGMPDLIQHQETGWLAPAFDIDALTQGLEYLLTHAHASAIREKCRSASMRRYSAEIVGSSYRELYERLLADKGAGK